MEAREAFRICVSKFFKYLGLGLRLDRSFRTSKVFFEVMKAISIDDLTDQRHQNSFRVKIDLIAL